MADKSAPLPYEGRAPSPSDTQKMAAIVVQQPAPHNPDHIPQWAVKGLIAIVVLIMIPGTIAVVSYVFGGIHSRLTDNETAIQQLKEDRAASDARQERAETANRRQWELMAENKEKIASHHHDH
jgi:hypothetical protein